MEPQVAWGDVWIQKRAQKTCSASPLWSTPAWLTRTRWPPSSSVAKRSWRVLLVFFNRSCFHIWLLSITTFSFSFSRLKKQSATRELKAYQIFYFCFSAGCSDAVWPLFHHHTAAAADSQCTSPPDVEVRIIEPWWYSLTTYHGSGLVWERQKSEPNVIFIRSETLHFHSRRYNISSLFSLFFKDLIRVISDAISCVCVY